MDFLWYKTILSKIGANEGAFSRCPWKKTRLMNEQRERYRCRLDVFLKGKQLRTTRKDIRPFKRTNFLEEFRPLLEDWVLSDAWPGSLSSLSQVGPPTGASQRIVEAVQHASCVFRPLSLTFNALLLFLNRFFFPPREFFIFQDVTTVIQLTFQRTFQRTYANDSLKYNKFDIIRRALDWNV